MYGGVPSDDDDVGVAGMAGQEGIVEGAGDRRPQGPAGLSVVLKHSPDEDGGLGGDQCQENRGLVVTLLVGTNDR